MITIYVEGDNPRPATAEEEIAISILQAAIKRIQQCPVTEETVVSTNNCDAIALAENAFYDAAQI